MDRRSRCGWTGRSTRSPSTPERRLLDALRERLGITSAKKGCDHGQCGACTVLLDGRRATSCLALAVAHDGAEIVTADGLADGDALHPHAAGVHRPRRLPVRLLHARPDRLGGRRCCTRSAAGWPSARDRGPRRRRVVLDRRGDPRADERQPVPLRRLRQHRAGHRGGGAVDEALPLRAAPPTCRPPSPRWPRAPAALPGRRHEPRRPDEARGGDARPAGRRQAARLRPDRGAARRRPADRRGACPTATWPPTGGPARATRCCPQAVLPAPRASCATSPPPAATCCSAPAACTSRTSPRRATSASPGSGCSARGRLRSATTRSSAPRTRASPPTRRTWPSPWPRSTRVVAHRRARRASGRSR